MKEEKVLQWRKTEMNDELDHVLHVTLGEMGDRVEISERLKARIVDGMMRAEKEKVRMSRIKWGKIAVAVTAASLLAGTVCVAGSGAGMFWTGGTSTTTEYKSFDDKASVEKELGYSFDAVESFPNGYQLEGFYLGSQYMESEGGGRSGEFKTLFVDYCKGSAPIISLHIGKFSDSDAVMDEDAPSPSTMKFMAGDVELSYSCYLYKGVPTDYEITKEEEAAVAAGKLQVGYGASELSVQEYSSLSWIKNGISYDLVGFDVGLGADGLVQMAETILAVE